MKLFGVLVLLVTLSAAYGLQCYTCEAVKDASDCKNTTCPHPMSDRCATLEYNGYIIKGCEIEPLCKSPIVCCKGDLCNSAITAGSSVLLLLVSSAITTAFL